MDRWVEIDIDWFGDPPWDRTIDRFVARTEPLFAGSDGLSGVCLNIGWLADLVTEWTGRPEQHLPLRSRRFARWASLTYEDLRRFLAQLRSAGAEQGIELTLGVLVAGLGEVVAPPVTGTMYDLFTHWHDRHPELYPLDISPLPGPDLDPRVPMRADDYPYATRPRGISEGEGFPEFFGSQWGSLAVFLGLDLIHLRDGFLGPMLYTRVGPYGTVAADDPAENSTWTDAVRRLFRACKENHPDGLVMAYSSGISGTAEWLVGCVDLEAIVADGALDIFVDQTWGGAWQDWWDDTWKGWTFQLAYLLGHGAQIRGANTQRQQPCKHYNLIETWDGWEPWDTLHDTPGKLEWAIWAFSHAAVIGPGGQPMVPEGTYVSWMNDWNGRLIGEQDMATLVRSIDAAQASAATLEEVFGPIVVLDRAGLETLAETDPASNGSEWIEDYAGMALKWGVAIGAMTRPEWLPADWPDGIIWQLPRELPHARADESGGAILFAGRADLIDARLLESAGVQHDNERLPPGYRLGLPASDDLPREERVHLPERSVVQAAPDAWVGYDSVGTPLLVGRAGRFYWQPPDLADPGNPLVPHSQIGSVSPYIEVARLIGREARRSGGIAVDDVPAHEPVTVGCWRSAGAIHILVGNLESGWMGDSRFARTIRIQLPRARLGLKPNQAYRAVPLNVDAPAIEATDGDSADVVALTLSVAPSACLVVRLEPAP
ncbi:MAG: hypothetical protein ACC726_10730 [Chloroflexota bacterium]